MTNALEEIAELINQVSGIQHPNHDRSLRAAISRIEPTLDAAAFLELLRHPSRGEAVLARLLDEVTVHESSFFREWEGLVPLSWHAMLAQAHARGSSVVRVWSAACSTGEEPYSLALSAWEAFGGADPPVRILGTDISRGALDDARAGRYRDRSLREVPAAMRAKYFTDDDMDHVIGERPRRLVEFREHNLAHDPVPPFGEEPFDLVLCRNVLIYLDAETVERVIPALERSTHPDGTLILGTADTLCGTTQRLARFAEQADAPVEKHSRPGRLRRPLGRFPDRRATLAEALEAAGEGRYHDALVQADAMLARDPLDADACFVRGLVLLESGSLVAAAESLRRALYIEPSFGVAAFQLGRAYDRLGDEAAARRVYAQALRTLDSDDERQELLLGQTGVSDIAAACSARLEALTESTSA
ncbi:MAG TPA: CheR family methyltransferase [Gaiellaceae bacterium]|nr:CheR family methyltransferase [Gaiellaceae bacterium]HWB21755.1 CheR family methyltransferase [Gaiellaceae bacterium]